MVYQCKEKKQDGWVNKKRKEKSHVHLGPQTEKEIKSGTSYEKKLQR